MVILGWPATFPLPCAANSFRKPPEQIRRAFLHDPWVVGFQGICVGSRDSAGEGSYARSRAGPDGGVRGTAYSATRVKGSLGT